MSSSNWCFLTCIQISQEAGQVVWYSCVFKNFPLFAVIHTKFCTFLLMKYTMLNTSFYLRNKPCFHGHKALHSFVVLNLPSDHSFLQRTLHCISHTHSLLSDPTLVTGLDPFHFTAWTLNWIPPSAYCFRSHQVWHLSIPLQVYCLPVRSACLWRPHSAASFSSGTWSAPLWALCLLVPAVLSSAVLRLLTHAQPPPFPLNQRKLVHLWSPTVGPLWGKAAVSLPLLYHPVIIVLFVHHPVLFAQTIIAPLLSAQLPWWLSSKESTCQCRRHGFNSWARKIPWRKKWQPTPVFLPGKSHGHRSLAGCSPGGCKRVRQDLKTQHNNNSKSRLWETLDG